MVGGLLLSRSCTTGWLDWNHGELILTADALVRVKLPEPTEAGRRMRNTVPGDPSVRRAVGLGEAAGLLNAHPTNRFIPLDEIESADLHQGVLSDRLAVRVADGSRYKFLWLHADPAYAILRDRLPGLIPGRVKV